MSDEGLIPASVGRAAKRAFIRTTAQGYAASIPTAITSGSVSGAFNDTSQTVVVVIAAVVSPFLAGAAAFFSMIGSGVPAEYKEAE